MNSSRNALYLAGVLFLAFSLRLLWIVCVPTEPVSDFAEFDRIAMSVVTGKGYVSVHGNPTTYRPPGYPLFLAGIYAVCGHSWLAARMVNVLLGMVVCFLIYLVAVQLFDQKTGLLSAIIVAGFPSHIMYGNLLATENLFIPLVWGAVAAFLRAMRGGQMQRRYLTATGVLLGLGTLTRPAVLLLPIAWGGTLIWKRIQIKRIIAVISLVGAAMTLTVLPWTIRNAIVSGEFVPVASEGGITFLAGHNERAVSGPYSLEGPVFDELFAAEQTEVERDAYAYKLAFQFIREHPKTEAILLARKFVYFFKDDVSGVSWNVQSSTQSFPQWLVYALKGIAQGYYVVVVMLALAFTFLKRFPSKDHWYMLLCTLFGYWTAIHLAFYGKDRFRLPLMPVFAIFAAVTLNVSWTILSQRLRSVPLE
jgi:4-amino-4-deoxy-L-arabinose transferase-like glycosyltransferase